MSEYIGHRGLPGELKHLSSLRKRKKLSRFSRDNIPLVAASETGTAQNHICFALEKPNLISPPYEGGD